MLGEKDEHQSEQQTQKDQDQDGQHDEGHANLCKQGGPLKEGLVRRGLGHLDEDWVKVRQLR